MAIVAGIASAVIAAGSAVAQADAAEEADFTTRQLAGIQTVKQGKLDEKLNAEKLAEQQAASGRQQRALLGQFGKRRSSSLFGQPTSSATIGNPLGGAGKTAIGG